MPIFWWALLAILLFSVMLGWTPVSGRISLLYFFEPVTGFMLIDALLSGEPGGLQVRRFAPDPTIRGARHDPPRRHRPNDTLIDARSTGR